MLDATELAVYRETGHLTVAGVFDNRAINAAVADAEAWAEAEIAALDQAGRAWYLEGGVTDRPVLRKLDNPVYHRGPFRDLAAHPAMLDLVAQIIGPGPRAVFSQIFFKAPRGSGPKPVHQDNFYFGPNRQDGMVTAWIALDDADVDNGCLFYGEGSNQGPVLPHVAPEGEPFNLLVPDDIARTIEMTPAPVPKGGVSFHHGRTLHQSSNNTSDRWRRACAIHYANAKTELVEAALTYDPDVVVTF